MKKNRLKRELLRWGMLLAFPALMSSCLMEYPEMTADGELGVDPTSVTVKAKILIDLKSLAAQETGRLARAEDEEAAYSHRIVVAAYEDRQLVQQEVIYEDLSASSRLQTEVRLRLHARRYQLVVWADYVQEGEEPFYDIDGPEGLASIIGREGYTGNTEYKDAFYSSKEIDLTGYKDEWNAEFSLEVTPERPLARYELTATDVTSFLREYPEVTKVRLTLKYDDYLPKGFNALDGITKHAFKYLQYSRTVSLPKDGATSLPLMFDYVFADSEGNTSVPVTLLVEDADKGTLLASSSFRLSCAQGENKDIQFDFLTTSPEDGVGFNPGFDGDQEVELPVE